MKVESCAEDANVKVVLTLGGGDSSVVDESLFC